MTEREKVLVRAIRTYGADLQTMVAVEEMAELTQAISKWWREPCGQTRDHVLEEMADVAVVLDELRILFGPTDGIEERKIRRLADRMR